MSQLERRLAEAAPAERQQFDVLWRVARVRVWQGDLTTDAATKRALGAEAAGLARSAIAIDGKRVEGHYYAALGIGIYCQGVGVLTILRERRDREFAQALDRALTIDPFFDRGGPLLAQGRYYYELPWPMRDLGKAIASFRRVLERFPDRRRGRLFLVEALLKDGQPADARAELDQLTAGPPDPDPPEARRVTELVRRLPAASH